MKETSRFSNEMSLEHRQGHEIGRGKDDAQKFRQPDNMDA